MAKYEAIRTENGVVATDDGAPLDKRLELFNHSPTGFEMGNSGSGPAQLALAILSHHFRSRLKSLNSATRATCDERTVRFYQQFKAAVIARVEGDYFTIETAGIEAVLERIKKQQEQRRTL